MTPRPKPKAKRIRQLQAAQKALLENAPRLKRMKAKRKAKRYPLLGRDATSQLYRAIIRYVESKGGKIVVISGVQVQEWSGDGKFCFRVAVRCAGRRPAFAEGDK